MDWSRKDMVAVGEGMLDRETRREAQIAEALRTGVLPSNFGE